MRHTFKLTVEIHRTREAPLKDYNLDEQKKLFFRVRMLSLRYVGFYKKISMRRQKRITFKKKVYQKIFISRGDMSFSRAKKNANFPKNPGNFQREINGN